MICNNCKKTFNGTAENSPMLIDETWNKVIAYYGISKDEEENRRRNFHNLWVKYDAIPTTGKKAFLAKLENPIYHVCFCRRCMENALNRKLTLKDLRNVPYNNIIL